MNGSFNNFPSIREMTSRVEQQAKNTTVQTKKPGSISFAEMLEKTTGNRVQAEPLKFSKHANLRMESRNLDLSEEQLGRLKDGVSKASEKGIKESLVMVDDMAFIVNVTNNTVITAVGSSDEKIFTNIDGAVVV
ncbi:MAG: flagellar protein [Lachnospiraceae bacterium]|nr:flagellar protein [Lachnospiraceae bacterium]